MVVPVPWKLLLLLKLLIRIFPCVNDPIVTGTTAIPYGFTSPLLGTVDATTLIVPACAAAINRVTVKNRNTVRGMSVGEETLNLFMFVRPPWLSDNSGSDSQVRQSAIYSCSGFWRDCQDGVIFLYLF